MRSDTKKIEQYLAGELEGAEKLEFEKQLKIDKGMLEELELRTKVDEAILESDIIELREALSFILSDERDKGQFLSRISFYWHMAAALILMLIIVKFVFFTNQQNVNNNELFSKYYELYQPLQPVRGDLHNIEMKNLYNQAIANYENKDYHSAEGLFKQIINVDSSDYMARFYLAMAQIEIQQDDEALKNLEFLILGSNHLFFEQSLWYTALIYLRQNDANKVKKILDSIVQNNYYNSKKAKRLLQQLN